MRLFGTDGIRGEVGKYPLTIESISKLAKASSLVLKKKNSISRVVINKDTGFQIICLNLLWLLDLYQWGLM
jgi:phosphomannomutase